MRKILLGVSSVLLLTLFSSCDFFCKKCDKTKDVKTERDKKNKKGKKIARMTPIGLKYEIVKEADDAAKVAQEGNKVMVHYTGYLSDKGKPGQKIDSSVDRGQPFGFTLGKKQVIVGFDEGVKEMKVGEKRRLTIPSYLAYGKNKVGNIIPEDSTLIFDVELIEVA
ncbi:MAG: FKBP-type peptidyl-prolyl cis-trans isomerase [bacterium]